MKLERQCLAVELNCVRFCMWVRTCVLFILSLFVAKSLAKHVSCPITQLWTVANNTSMRDFDQMLSAGWALREEAPLLHNRAFSEWNVLVTLPCVFPEPLETSLRRSAGTSSMSSSKSSAPCSQATRGKWTRRPCWRRSLDSCRNTMVKVTLLAIISSTLPFPRVMHLSGRASLLSSQGYNHHSQAL